MEINCSQIEGRKQNHYEKYSKIPVSNIMEEKYNPFVQFFEF